MADEKFDLVGFIMAAEEGSLTAEEYYAGLQQMIDSGVAYSLQGSWGRAADAAIKAGECTPRKAKS